MTKRQAENRARLFERLAALGFTHDESEKLVRIERTLQRWGELECGNDNGLASYCISRDEETGKPFMEFHPHSGGAVRKYPVPDRERGALKRLSAMMTSRPELTSYHQSDCRGCNLYIIPKADLKGRPADSAYTVGVAVCY